MTPKPHRVPVCRIAALCGVFLFAACGAEEQPDSGALVLSGEHWSLMEDVSLDPIPEHQPSDMPECVTHVVVSALEVSTDTCPYYVGGQPLQHTVTAGTELQLELTHIDLLGDGTAHLALAVEGNLLWEREIEIPKGGTLYEPSFVVEEDLEEGSMAIFHLHNHGANSYYFKTLKVK